MSSETSTRPASPAAGGAPAPAERGLRLPAWLDTPLTSYYLVLGSSVVLIGLGLVMVLSSSSVDSLADGQSAFTVFWRQAVFALIGVPLMVLAARMPPKSWAALGWPLLVGAMVMQLLVFTSFGVGVNGNRNWVSLGGFQLQPSEIGKLALCVWVAAVLARKRPLLGEPVHAMVPVVPGALLFLALVLYGADLGTALIVMAIMVGTMFVAGCPKRIFVFGGGALALLTLVMVMTSSNRLGRIASWRSDCTGDAALGACFQSLHGKYALATGGWWGVGLGASREKWGLLPEAHNDFIFAIIGEELGLVGTLAVVGLFAACAVGMFRIVLRHTDPFVKIATAGVLAWVIGQAVVNIGVVIGLLPVIGLPLPLVSSGGSALVMTMAALGMVIGFARHEPGAQQALAARAGLVRRSLAVVGRGRR
ncbi:putative lipid II flippase FtsW [Spongisporangium articulatum]|uniref:Probable peptidoglycan glycosyltransferase FtsW n=1 Tax=Spongisporangium articulatum TaxID=3362603 RepID=A0ABW8ASQ3_9ACTN